MEKNYRGSKSGKMISGANIFFTWGGGEGSGGARRPRRLFSLPSLQDGGHLCFLSVEQPITFPGSIRKRQTLKIKHCIMFFLF